MSEQSATSTSSDDAFLYDTDQLNAIADDETIRQGLAWFKDNSVHSLSREDDTLLGMVEDGDSEEDIACHLSYSANGILQVDCDCNAFQTENKSNVCTHAVAVLYAYAAQSIGGEFLGAVESAIELRAKRGRNEVAAEHLEGEPWFGTWKASSITSSLAFPRSYRVTIRSLSKRSNVCNCQDYAINQLGTCKHIEAVLHKISKRDDYEKIKSESAPVSYVYLSWDVENPPQLLLHRSLNIKPDLAAFFDDYFNARGVFKGRLPDNFFHFSAQVQDRDDLHIGEDAQAYVQRLSTQASQIVHAQKIREQIEASSGRLSGVNATLYPYQVEGVAFLAANGRGLLADDMGLGKTLQSIAAASWLIKNSGVERVLVVCPASLKQQWAREIEKFTDYSVQIIQGKPETRAVQYRRGKGFYIINYELVLRDLTVINETLNPDLLILDEAQRIKNWRTKIASTIKLIPTSYAFVLSGTPLENRLEDLFSLLQVVDTNVLGPLWRYLIDFHITDERGKVLGYRNLSELRRRLEPIMLRRDRRLVSDQLPRRIDQRIDVELTDLQRELHDSAMSTAGQLANIAKTRPLTPGESNRMMASLQMARMACNAAGLVDKETEGSPKLDEMENLIDELCVQAGQKAVIFSQWKLMTSMVELRLKKMGVGFVHLHGGVPTANRGELMARFRDDDAIQVFVSTDAGGVGLNLQNASVVINLDMPWNPAILDQRIARVHRLGQKNTVQSILIISADSYEEKVALLVKGKRDLFDNVIDPDASEDVVGVSKKLLETLVEDLAGKDDAQKQTQQQDQEQENETEAPEIESSSSAANDKTSESYVENEADSQTDLKLETNIQQAIEAIQQYFGSGIEQILGSGGGILVVLDHVDAEANLEAQKLSSDEVPIAIIDTQTLGGLQRLGENSPIQTIQKYYDAKDNAQDNQQTTKVESPLIAIAKEKLEAAEILLEQEMYSVATNLLITA
ncbi:MAG TPA: helicase, partial [Leucothrix sp.]|nr:helicase [Leucothrix sp.]